MSTVFFVLLSNKSKFGVKLAAAERAQVPHGDDSFKTESQSPLKQDSMQGWKQQNDWRHPQSERGHDMTKNKTSSWASGEFWTPKNRRPASDGFRARYPFFRDGARCLGDKYTSKQLVYVESKDRHGKCTLHLLQQLLERMGGGSGTRPWNERVRQDPKEILQVEAVRKGQ